MKQKTVTVTITPDIQAQLAHIRTFVEDCVPGVTPSTVDLIRHAIHVAHSEYEAPPELASQASFTDQE